MRLCVASLVLLCVLSADVRAEDALATSKPVKAMNTAALPGKVLVLETRTTGAEAALVATLPDLLARAISGHKGFEVASQAELKGLLALDKTRQQVGCAEDTACISEITNKLNAEYVVSSSLGQLGRTYVLSLSLLDAKHPGANQRVSESFDGLDALKAGLAASVANLLGEPGRATAPAFRLRTGKSMSFAVFDLQASGVAPEVATNLTQIVSAEVKSVQGTSVVSRDDIVALLQFDKQKAELGCTEDTECMARIGGALGVDRLVVGHVGRVAEDYVIALRLIDARRATVENRQTESFRGGEDQLIGATRHAVRQLLGLEEKSAGRIAVTASQPAVEVFIDNEKQGKLPLPPIEKLVPGRHNVRLAKDGFFDWQSDVYVSQLETTVAWAQLKERPLQWYQQWWVWTAAGVVIAGTTTAAILATRPAPTTGTGTVGFP